MNYFVRLLLLTVLTASFTIKDSALAVSAANGISIETYKRRLTQALQAVSRRTPDRARRQIEFGANLFIAHEAWIGSTPQAALIKVVDALKEAGVDRVDINPGLFPWVDADQVTIAKYDAVIHYIKEHGMKLNINLQYSPVKHQMYSFSDWQTHAIVLCAQLAKRYHPDTFVVVHEPSTMSSRLKTNVSVSDWMDFVRQTAKAVKKNSPHTRIGTGCLASEREYFYAFIKMPEVEVLTIDIYSIRDLKIYNAMIRAAQVASKPIYIEETWRPPFFQPEPGMTLDAISLKNVGNKALEASDSEWLSTMTAYAQANHLEAITPVWIFTFFKYIEGDGDLDDSHYNQAVIDAIMKNDRTRTFFTLKKLIQDNQYLRSSQ